VNTSLPKGRRTLSSTDTRVKTQRAVAIGVDFGQAVDYPLSKMKFAVYNSGLVTLDRYKRDAERFADVGPESLRIDIAWGWGPGWNPYAVPPVTGTAEHLLYNFAELDELARLLNSKKVRPYWSYCYMPVPLQQGDDWRSAPVSMEGWEQVLRAFARHYRAQGISIGYHEVYNEPDLIDPGTGPVFFTGTRDQYFEMYRRGASGIKAEDPDAVVGGPALAFTDERSWITAFLEDVRAHDLPLDFFSFHHYGPGVGATVERMRDGLSRDPRFATTEMHLNEYNSLPVDYPLGGPQEKHPSAAMLLQDFHDLLAYPCLTKVSWAQFLDSGQDNYSGMVSFEGRRKAVFNAYNVYMGMPVDRRRVSVSGSEAVGGMAATDGHRADLVLWNSSDDDQTVSVDLSHAPFATATLRVYRIDADHASWGDDPAREELAPVDTSADVRTAGLTWMGNIPRDGVVYLALDDGTTVSAMPPAPVATIIRTLHYYPDRTTAAYADFDKSTWTARLGMATEQRAEAVVGATLEGLPDRLDLRVAIDGTLQRLDANSLLGVRLDYMVDGAYATSVLFHGSYASGPDLYDVDRASPTPWGTGRQADRVIAITDLARFQIEVGVLAPIGWSGRAQLTFIMQNTGPGTRAKMIVRQG